MKNKKIRLTSFQIIALGFAGVVLAGALLLMLPFSTRSHECASFVDALFTATSATCVTGLITQDTATYWSGFGQFIILLLIQIGGMGVITVAIILGLISKKRLSIAQKSTLQSAISAPDLGSSPKLVKFFVKISLIVEGAGAIVMFPVFFKQFGLLKGIWYAIFHSISAFCNAGFDLMGTNEKFSSLTSFYNNPLINLVIMFLIFFGGIGFLTWDDMLKHKFDFAKYRVQSKIALIMATILIVFPFIYFYFVEFTATAWDGLSSTDKIFTALFQTVTTRTAGFNTVDLAKMSPVSKAIMIILMLIGGTSGSTAGGIKTTTIAVLIFSANAVFHRRENTNAFKRRIPDEVVRNAAAILIVYIILLLTGSLLICSIENIPLLTSIFESASAIATVGLTLGVTTKLHVLSKLILIILMYFGRVGGLTLIYAAISADKGNLFKYPQENISIG